MSTRRMAVGSLTTATVPRMVGPTISGSSKWNRVQVSIGFLCRTHKLARTPSGAFCGTGAGGRGNLVTDVGRRVTDGRARREPSRPYLSPSASMLLLILVLAVKSNKVQG